MANQYDTNLKLQAIADAIGDSQSSGLISALEDIADAVAGGGGGGSSTAGLVSDNFSETDTYDLGDYCIHNNTLYVCINAIATPGSWDLSDWQATNAGIQLSSLNSAIAENQWKSISPVQKVLSYTYPELINAKEIYIRNDLAQPIYIVCRNYSTTVGYRTSLYASATYSIDYTININRATGALSITVNGRTGWAQDVVYPNEILYK